MYGGEDTCIQGFGGEEPEGQDHLENLGMEGRILLKCIFKT
jgi:hypothetical protein